VSSPRKALVVVAVAVAPALIVAGCGSKAKSAGSASSFKAALAGAPAPLARLYSKPNQILDGGPPAYEHQIKALKGFPIVVNKWASWCGPCRFEFPFFQKLSRRHGKSIAFLGVDSNDARDDAREFLKELPVPYPSFFDPDSSIAALFRGDRVFPTTAFYNRKGELVFTKQGGYPSEAALAQDIARYAR
jgi:thiol-disulfide isomerase/thioredoxin